MTIFILWIASAAIGLAIGAFAGRAAAGLLYGLLLGPIGWFVVLAFANEDEMRQRSERRSQAKEDKRLANKFLADQYRQSTSSGGRSPN